MLKSMWSQLRNSLLMFRGDYSFYKDWVRSSQVRQYRNKEIFTGCVKERQNNGDYKITMFVFDMNSQSVLVTESFQIPTLSEEFEEKFRNDGHFDGIFIDLDDEKRISVVDLKIFLCYASDDKPAVKTYHEKLNKLGAKTWIDDKDLLPGQKWEMIIQDEIRNSDIVIVFLSRKSISKRGYVQKEIRYALSIAEEMPEGTIFIIPARLEECEVPFSLQNLHWANLYEKDGFDKMQLSLVLRANNVQHKFHIQNS